MATIWGRPTPRVADASAALDAGIRCAIDVSDGLVQDLSHICEASSVNATIRLPDLPLDPDLVAMFPDDAITLAAAGGEDYELLLVGTPAAIDALRSRAAMTIIGEIIARTDSEPPVRCVDAAGATIDLGSGGWDHLAGASAT